MTQFDLSTAIGRRRAVRIAVGLGIQKVRLTGGEPLLRQQTERLVESLAAIPGITDLAMTSNGFLFCQKGKALREAGLRRVNVHLDSLDLINPARFISGISVDPADPNHAWISYSSYNLLTPTTPGRCGSPRW